MPRDVRRALPRSRRAGGDDDDDADFLARRRQRVQAARRKWRVRFLVKCTMWLVGAYTVRLWDKETLKIYLIVSVLAYIYFSVVHEGDHEYGVDGVESYEQRGSNQLRRDTTDPLPPPPHQQPQMRQTGHEQPRQRSDPPAHLADASALRRRNEGTGAAAEPVGGASPIPQRGPSGAGGTLSASTQAAGPATLNPQQQLQLLSRMRALGTANAMRCVTDAAFREAVRSADRPPLDECVCGSGQAFGRCCLQIHEELKAFL